MGKVLIISNPSKEAENENRSNTNSSNTDEGNNSNNISNDYKGNKTTKCKYIWKGSCKLVVNVGSNIQSFVKIGIGVMNAPMIHAN